MDCASVLEGRLSEAAAAAIRSNEKETYYLGSFESPGSYGFFGQV